MVENIRDQQDLILNIKSTVRDIEVLLFNVSNTEKSCCEEKQPECLLDDIIRNQNELKEIKTKVEEIFAKIKGGCQ